VERVFSNVQLDTPVSMTQLPYDKSRWFVANRGIDEGDMAKIVSFPVASPPNVPTVVATVGPTRFTTGEGGLLGLAFDPKCTPAMCRLFISYVGDGFEMYYSRSIIAVLTSTDNGATFSAPTEILGFEATPAGTHRGGGIAFGNDGYLYVSFGDTSGGDDEFLLAQQRTGFAAKIHRIDVNNVPAGKKFGIPADNPFAAGGGEPSTFAYGFRNPFRFSIDRATGDVWTGDVGQGGYEEIDRVQLGGNYGWPCREGLHDYISDPGRCPSPVGLLDPVVEHKHVTPYSRAIIGGAVYRGSAIPSLVGTYVYGDYVTGELFTLTLDPTTGAAKSTPLNNDPINGLVEIAQDNDGELYVLQLSPVQIWKVVAAGAEPPNTFPDRLSKTGCVDPADAKKPAAGLVPYGVNAQLWSDGAAKERFVALPDGKTITVGADGDFDLPTGSVAMKTFSVGGKRIETRLMIRHDDGGWAGYSYEWLDDQGDAVLLPSSKTKKVGTQTWSFPSRGECMRCHTDAAGRTLGLELAQLNGDVTYPSTNRISNQLDTLDHIGMFAAALGKPGAELPIMPKPEGTAPVDQRARAYLHANCAQCHRPNGGARGDLDLRFSTPFAATKTCNAAAVTGDQGVAGAKVFVPGAPAKSLLSIRPHAPPGAVRMPPLASTVVDTQGLAVVDAWITGTTACP